jgi:mRNA interferase RelE/StbE
MATPHVPTPYTLLTLPAARRQLRQLERAHNRNVRDILATITFLADTPRPVGSRKLTNRPELRVRVGDYRILYLVDDVRRTVTISFIAHRRDVYR